MHQGNADCRSDRRPRGDRAHPPPPGPMGAGRAGNTRHRPASANGHRALARRPLPGLRHRAGDDVREQLTHRGGTGLPLLRASTRQTPSLRAVRGMPRTARSVSLSLLSSRARSGSVSTMKSRIQAAEARRVPAPAEKRFPIRILQLFCTRSRPILTSCHLQHRGNPSMHSHLLYDLWLEKLVIPTNQFRYSMPGGSNHEL